MRISMAVELVDLSGRTPESFADMDIAASAFHPTSLWCVAAGVMLVKARRHLRQSIVKVLQ